MRRLLKNKRYRWEKDKIDVRDYRYQPTQISSLPKIVDLTKKLPMVYNQGRLGAAQQMHCMQPCISQGLHMKI